MAHLVYLSQYSVNMINQLLLRIKVTESRDGHMVVDQCKYAVVCPSMQMLKSHPHLRIYKFAKNAIFRAKTLVNLAPFSILSAFIIYFIIFGQVKCGLGEVCLGIEKKRPESQFLVENVVICLLFDAVHADRCALPFIGAWPSLERTQQHRYTQDRFIKQVFS